MNLHANAALSLNQRWRLARRLCEQGWQLADAAAASERLSGRPRSDRPDSAPLASPGCSIEPLPPSGTERWRTGWRRCASGRASPPGRVGTLAAG
jgi:hypothetical protein